MWSLVINIDSPKAASGEGVKLCPIPVLVILERTNMEMSKKDHHKKWKYVCKSHVLSTSGWLDLHKPTIFLRTSPVILIFSWFYTPTTLLGTVILIKRLTKSLSFENTGWVIGIPIKDHDNILYYTIMISYNALNIYIVYDIINQLRFLNIAHYVKQY
jgi:hypothetical protein